MDYNLSYEFKYELLKVNNGKTNNSAIPTNISKLCGKFAAAVKWMLQTLLYSYFILTMLSCYCDDIPTSEFYNIYDAEDFFINTSQCQIPYVNPLMPEIMESYKPRNTTDCSKYDPLIRIFYNTQTYRYVLHMDMKAVYQYNPANNFTTETDLLKCCYKEIRRSDHKSESDSRFTLSSCKNFPQNFSVPSYIDSLLVFCKLNLTTEIIEEKNAFFLIQTKNRTKHHKVNKTAKIKPALLLWSIDSLSRINFRRTMPYTFEYLMRNKWFELRGYNKVGQLSYPNMMALLTGQNESTIHKTCNPKRGYDNCDFIWREFQEQGYKTAYAEDTALNSTFNIKSPGFKVPPTDYYFRPMSLAIEKTFKKTTKNGISYCIGNRQYGEYVYEMGLRFAKRFRNRPYFGLFRTKSFSHGDYSLPATMDLKLLNYFKEMEIVGIFDHAIVFFFSDCGLLPSPLDKLPEGLLEERLPTFFISIPKWFRGNYWNLVRKLEANCQRLTSPYDIYMTMQHLLQIDLINSTMKQATGCLQCKSLFEEIPESRRCYEAGILNESCTCSQKLT